MKSAAKLFNGLCIGSGSEIVTEQNNCRTNKVEVVVNIHNYLILPLIDSYFSILLYQTKLFSYYFTMHYSRHSL